MKLAIFDFDGTYLEKQTLSFLYKIWKEEQINDKAYKKVWHNILHHYFLNKLHLMSKSRFRAYAMQRTAEMFASVERNTLDDFLNLFYEKMKPFVSKKIRTEMLEDKKQGYHTILLIGNFDMILKPFLQEGFNEVIGSKSEENGKLMNWRDIDIIISEKKQEIIRHRFPDADYESSKAYADSDYDLPIFQLVGIPIAVKPDKKLRKIAIEKGFRIID